MIHSGDLFDVLPTLAAESIDACVTDPPYGIGFIGREWDTFKPGTGKTRKLMHPRERVAAAIVSDNPNIHGRHRSPALSPSQIDYDYSTAGLRGFQRWTEQWAVEVFRVLKPGAYIVVCGAPRSHHRMMCGLEDAGFVVRDCFAWLFGSGFPKNRDMGAGRGTALKPANEPIALAWKPFKGSITANVAKWGTGALNIDATRIRPTSQGESRSSSESSSEGTGLWLAASRICHSASSQPSVWSAAEHAPLAILLASALGRDLQSGSLPDSRVDCLPCPGCDDGRARFGAVVVRASVPQLADAREPLDLQWIASRIRDCRCAVHPSIWDALAQQVSSGKYSGRNVQRIGESSANRRYSESGSTNFAATPGPRGGDDLGRWPANVLIDEDAAAVLDEMTGELQSGTPAFHGANRDIYGKYQGAACDFPRDANSGGASRFYYVAKPSREERDFGTHGLIERARDESRKPGNPGGDNPRNRGLQPRGNFHPTVKPVELMRWLVKLVTPIGGTVLDPFTGSGTTGMACRYEQREFIGIEKEAEYLQIAERRIAAVAPLFSTEASV